MVCHMICTKAKLDTQGMSKMRIDTHSRYRHALCKQQCNDAYTKTMGNVAKARISNTNHTIGYPSSAVLEIF